jgi:RHS repeat-associated protein
VGTGGIPVPVAVDAITGVSQISAGSFNSMALLNTGKVMVWGTNQNGDLGIGTFIGPSHACSEVQSLILYNGCSLEPIEVPGVSEVTAVSAGDDYDMALQKNGTVLAWGENAYGELADGHQYGPGNCQGQPCETHPHEVQGLGGEAIAVSANKQSLALMKGGHIEAWGWNVWGQLGIGVTNGPETCAEMVPCSYIPREVMNITNATAVAAGGEFSMALLSDGSVRTWGNNEQGELGNGTTTASNAPVIVNELSSVTAIAADDVFSLALLSNGTVKAWGNNSGGELGDGNTTNSDVPVTVSGISNAVAIAAGGGLGLALLSNGTVVSWGENGEGQLGDGGFGMSDVPVPVSGLTGIGGIAAGFDYALATGANPQPGAPPKLTPEEQFGKHNKSQPNITRFCAGKPVNCATGNETESQTDVTTGGRGIPLTFSRDYNAIAAVTQPTPGSFGYGWSSTFSDHLVIDSLAGTDTVVQANGSTAVFKSTGMTGEQTAPAWVQAKLSLSGDGTYLYTLPTQLIFHFDAAGRLLSESDRNGNVTTMNRNAEGRLESVTDAAGRKLTFGYTSEGEVESVTDPMGHVVKYSYEGGNLTRVTLPGESSPRWRFEYDSSHRMTTMTDGRGGTTKNEYDSENRVVWQQDPASRATRFEYEPEHTIITNIATGAVTETYFTAAGEPYQVRRAVGTSKETFEGSTYDSSGALIAATDGNGHTTTYGYDGAGNRTLVRDPDGNETKWSYDSAHDVISTTTPKGETTTIKRDSHGNPEVIERPAPGGATELTRYKYNSLGELESTTDPLEHTTKYEYNSQGDRSVEIDPEGDKRTWEYNGDSQQTAMVGPRGNVTGGEPAKYTTKTERDAQGRPVTVTDPLGHKTKYTYDGNGNLETQTDPNGHKTTYRYDADNEQIKVEAPNTTITETGYDGAGQVTSQTDGNKHTTKYVRDALEQVTEVIDPRERKTTKQYDRAGNLVKLTDPANRTTTNVYDPANRLTEVSYSGGTHAVQYEYNRDGERTKMIDGTGTSTYTYDQLDRLIESKDGHGDITKYEYDLASEETKVTYPNGKVVTQSYDKAGRLEKITDWLEHTTKFAYDPNSNLATITFPTGTSNVDKYTYNEADQLSEVKMTKGTETLASLLYTRDNDGQIKGVTSKGLPGEEKPAYEYDTNNRLTKAGASAYEYDSADNPTKVPGSTNTYDNADELKTGASLTYTYNELGERTKRTPTSGAATTYSYNQAGNLTSVTRPKEAKTAEINDSYTYDGNDLRASQTISGTTSYLTWNPTQSVPLILNDGTNSYIYGPSGLPIEQIASSGTVTYLHHDQQGSTRLLTSSTGTVTGSTTFDAYGNKTGSTGTVTTPLGYDGQYTSSDTGLIYLRARVYDPATAQFLSVDPLVWATREPYAYAGDNPLTFGDPNGLAFHICVGGTVSLGFFTVEANACYVNTPGGEGLAVSGGVSRGPGLGVNVHAGAGGSNAQTPEEYGGPFATAGGSAQAGFGGYAGGFFGQGGSCNTVVAGGTAGISAGLGAEAGVGSSYTEVFVF